MSRRLVGLFAAVLGGFASGASPAPTASPPFVVALLVDTSGSVGAPELERARRLADALLDGLPSGSEIAVFRFDDQSKLVLPRTTRREDVRRALARLAPAGRKTALNDALFDGSKYVREAAGGRGAVVLLTDGVDEDSAVDLEDGLRLAETARIPVYTIGVGKVQEKSLRRIAKLTGGEYLPIAKATGTALARSIAASLERASEPAAATGVATPPGLSAASPVPTLAARPTAAPPPVTTPPERATTRPRWPWMLLGGLALAGVVLGVVASRRGRDARCPTCQRPLAHPFAACPSCAAGTAGDGPATVKGADLSATMVTKLHATDESLDKTITLRDRPVLNVTKGLGTGRVFELNLDTSTSLGRARANDVVLEDVAVSSEHCRVRWEEGRFVVHDLKSTNGTFVNDRRVTRHPLEEGDVLQVGETYLTFRREHRRV
jgi:hypothetical protein